jgi:hypothetical protein
MRVRWGNVGRAAAVVGVLALAVAWPRLEGGAPRLPSDAAIPLAGAGGKVPAGRSGPARRKAAGQNVARSRSRVGAARRRAAMKKAARRRAERRKAARRRASVRRAARRRAARRRKAAERTKKVEREAVKAPVPPSTPAVPAPRPAAPRFRPADPATTEFSFER